VRVSKERSAVKRWAFLYIVRCSDGSYYSGTARDGLEKRIAQHNSGIYGGYTATRRPVALVFSQWFDRIVDAIAAERQVKGWSRAKKEALIRGDFEQLKSLARRRKSNPHGEERGRRPNVSNHAGPRRAALALRDGASRLLRVRAERKPSLRTIPPPDRVLPSML
jgi:putative endonuclease